MKKETVLGILIAIVVCIAIAVGVVLLKKSNEEQLFDRSRFDIHDMKPNIYNYHLKYAIWPSKKELSEIPRT